MQGSKMGENTATMAEGECSLTTRTGCKAKGDWSLMRASYGQSHGGRASENVRLAIVSKFRKGVCVQAVEVR